MACGFSGSVSRPICCVFLACPGPTIHTETQTHSEYWPFFVCVTLGILITRCLWPGSLPLAKRADLLHSPLHAQLQGLKSHE